MVGPVEEVADLGGEADGLAVVGATEGVALAEWGVEVIAVGVEVVAGCVEVGCVEAVSSSVIRLHSGTYTTIFASRPSTVLPPGTEVRICSVLPLEQRSHSTLCCDWNRGQTLRYAPQEQRSEYALCFPLEQRSESVLCFPLEQRSESALCFPQE